MSRRPALTEQRGRQFTKRKVSVYRLDDGSEVETQETRAPRVTRRKLPGIMAEMAAVIATAEVDTTGLLDDAGSLLVAQVGERLLLLDVYSAKAKAASKGGKGKTGKTNKFTQLIAAMFGSIPIVQKRSRPRAGFCRFCQLGTWPFSEFAEHSPNVR